jgi:8-hydroxy-5-deazaflavin:NADPH oxidoreductase
MHIAIVGAGNVGRTLGGRWASGGHRVDYGVRNPADPKHAELRATLLHGGQILSVRDAAAAAEVILLATPWDGTAAALQECGSLAGKIIADATNPIVLGPELLKTGLLIGHTTSGAEQIAAWSPGALVVKAFNCVGWPVMANPIFDGRPACMPICGDDPAAKRVVTSLSDELGFATFDAGALATARLLEPYGMFWIHLAFGQGWGPQFAFQLSHR